MEWGKCPKWKFNIEITTATSRVFDPKNERVNLLNFLYLQVSLEWYQTNASASLLWPIQIYDLSPSLSSDQLHPSYDCVFPIVTVGFCLGVSVWLSSGFSFLYVNSISFSLVWHLLQILTPASTYLFYMFCCTFPIWSLPWLTSTFSFYNRLILFILVPNFRQNWQIS